MTETLFSLVSDWGAVALALAAFLSCLAMPVPTSLMMLAAGAFAASGDLSVAGVGLAALAGAVLGDQAGFGLGRAGGQALDARLRANRTRARALARAERVLERRGTAAVFFSRWLFSPLGPYVNLLAGAARMDWRGFTAASIAGELVWVTGYVGLGWAFGGQIGLMADILGNAVGLLSAGALAAVLGAALWRLARRQPRRV